MPTLQDIEAEIARRESQAIQQVPQQDLMAQLQSELAKREQAQPRQSFFSGQTALDMGNSLNRGLINVGGTLKDIGSLMVDPYNTVTGDKPIFHSADEAAKIMKNWGALDTNESQNTPARYVGKVIEQAPTNALFGLGGLLTGASGSLAEQGAKEAGYGARGQAGANMLGQISPSIVKNLPSIGSRLLGALTGEGVKDTASAILKGQVGERQLPEAISDINSYVANEKDLALQRTALENKQSLAKALLEEKPVNLGNTPEEMAANISKSELQRNQLAKILMGEVPEAEKASIINSLDLYTPEQRKMIAGIKPDQISPTYMSELSSALMGEPANKKQLLERTMSEYVPESIPLSTAEITQNAGISRLQDALKQGANEDISAFDKARVGLRSKLVKGDTPESMLNMTPMERGDLQRELLKQEASKMKEEATKLYEEIRPEESALIPVEQAYKNMGKTQADIVTKVGAPVESTQGVLGRMRDAITQKPKPTADPQQSLIIQDSSSIAPPVTPTPKVKALPMKPLTVKEVNAITGDLGEIVTTARIAGKNKEALIAGTMKKELEDALYSPEGLTEELQSKIKNAKKFYSEYKTKFGEDTVVGDIIGVNPKTKMPYIAGENVSKEIYKDTNTLEQAMRAAGDNKEAQQAIRSHLISQLDVSTPGKFLNKFKSGDMLGIAVASDKHLDDINRVVDSMLAEKGATDLASKSTGGGSATAGRLKMVDLIKEKSGAIQNMLASPKIATMIGGVSGAMMGKGDMITSGLLAGVGGLFGSALNNIALKRAGAVNELLVKAAYMDPELASMLLQRADPITMKKFFSKITTPAIASSIVSATTSKGAQ